MILNNFEALNASQRRTFVFSRTTRLRKITRDINDFLAILMVLKNLGIFVNLHTTSGVVLHPKQWHHLFELHKAWRHKKPPVVWRLNRSGSFVAGRSRALGSQPRGLEFDPYSGRSRSATLSRLRLTLASSFGRDFKPRSSPNSMLSIKYGL